MEMKQETITQRVLELPTLSVKQLVALWDTVYDMPVPNQNKPHLVMRLAYRLQELHYGGLSKKTQVRLEHLAAAKKPVSKLNKEKPVTGTRLIRVYQGVEHHVTVLANGYEYQGQLFKSLSAIARHITGTQWSGAVFFGLKHA